MPRQVVGWILLLVLVALAACLVWLLSGPRRVLAGAAGGGKNGPTGTTWTPGKTSTLAASPTTTTTLTASTTTKLDATSTTTSAATSTTTPAATPAATTTTTPAATTTAPTPKTQAKQNTKNDKQKAERRAAEQKAAEEEAARKKLADQKLADQKLAKEQAAARERDLLRARLAETASFTEGWIIQLRGALETEFKTEKWVNREKTEVYPIFKVALDDIELAWCDDKFIIEYRKVASADDKYPRDKPLPLKSPILFKNTSAVNCPSRYDILMLRITDCIHLKKMMMAETPSAPAVAAVAAVAAAAPAAAAAAPAVAAAAPAVALSSAGQKFHEKQKLAAQFRAQWTSDLNIDAQRSKGPQYYQIVRMLQKYLCERDTGELSNMFRANGFTDDEQRHLKKFITGFKKDKQIDDDLVDAALDLIISIVYYNAWFSTGEELRHKAEMLNNFFVNEITGSIYDICTEYKDKIPVLIPTSLGFFKLGVDTFADRFQSKSAPIITYRRKTLAAPDDTLNSTFILKMMLDRLGQVSLFAPKFNGMITTGRREKVTPVTDTDAALISVIKIGEALLVEDNKSIPLHVIYTTLVRPKVFEKRHSRSIDACQEISKMNLFGTAQACVTQMCTTANNLLNCKTPLSPLDYGFLNSDIIYILKDCFENYINAAHLIKTLLQQEDTRVALYNAQLDIRDNLIKARKAATSLLEHITAARDAIAIREKYVCTTRRDNFGPPTWGGTYSEAIQDIEQQIAIFQLKQFNYSITNIGQLIESCANQMNPRGFSARVAENIMTHYSTQLDGVLEGAIAKNKSNYTTYQKYESQIKLLISTMISSAKEYAEKRKKREIDWPALDEPIKSVYDPDAMPDIDLISPAIGDMRWLSIKCLTDFREHLNEIRRDGDKKRVSEVINLQLIIDQINTIVDILCESSSTYSKFPPIPDGYAKYKLSGIEIRERSEITFTDGARLVWPPDRWYMWQATSDIACYGNIGASIDYLVGEYAKNAISLAGGKKCGQILQDIIIVANGIGCASETTNRAGLHELVVTYSGLSLADLPSEPTRFRVLVSRFWMLYLNLKSMDPSSLYIKNVQKFLIDDSELKQLGILVQNVPTTIVPISLNSEMPVKDPQINDLKTSLERLITPTKQSPLNLLGKYNDTLYDYFARGILAISELYSAHSLKEVEKSMRKYCKQSDQLDHLITVLRQNNLAAEVIEAQNNDNGNGAPDSTAATYEAYADSVVAVNGAYGMSLRGSGLFDYPQVDYYICEACNSLTKSSAHEVQMAKPMEDLAAADYILDPRYIIRGELWNSKFDGLKPLDVTHFNNVGVLLNKLGDLFINLYEDTAPAAQSGWSALRKMQLGSAANFANTIAYYIYKFIDELIMGFTIIMADIPFKIYSAIEMCNIAVTDISKRLGNSSSLFIKTRKTFINQMGVSLNNFDNYRVSGRINDFDSKLVVHMFYNNKIIGTDKGDKKLSAKSSIARAMILRLNIFKVNEKLLAGQAHLVRGSVDTHKFTFPVEVVENLVAALIEISKSHPISPGRDGDARTAMIEILKMTYPGKTENEILLLLPTFIGSVVTMGTGTFESNEKFQEMTPLNFVEAKINPSAKSDVIGYSSWNQPGELHKKPPHEDSHEKPLEYLSTKEWDQLELEHSKPDKFHMQESYFREREDSHEQQLMLEEEGWVPGQQSLLVEVARIDAVYAAAAAAAERGQRSLSGGLSGGLSGQSGGRQQELVFATRESIADFAAGIGEAMAHRGGAGQPPGVCVLVVAEPGDLRQLYAAASIALGGAGPGAGSGAGPKSDAKHTKPATGWLYRIKRTAFSNEVYHELIAFIDPSRYAV